MKIAVLATIFVIGAGILGFVFKPTEEQQRPLSAEPGAAGAGDAHDDHGHHH